MTAADDGRWPDMAWPGVRAALPAPPGRVVEIGCGPTGGFVPALLADGYAAVGVDPKAPDGDAYRHAAFEDVALDGPVDAVVSSMALHHVHDLGGILDRVADLLVPGGTVVVLEWAWDRFDDRAARWCFDRLPPPPAEASDAHDHQHGWLRHHHDDWVASGRPWAEHLQAWAAAEHLHSSIDMGRELDRRFARAARVDIPYFAGDLPGVTPAEEQAALDAGDLPPTAFRHVAHLL